MTCTLCKSGKEKVRIFAQKRFFFKCSECNLIFADPQYLPDAADEKERYHLHQNSLEDVQYLDFLLQSIEPVKQFLQKQNKILDYGCGPVPALQQLLKKRGLIVKFLIHFSFQISPQENLISFFQPKHLSIFIILQKNWKPFITC
jgi:hypothetical protein